MGWPPIRSFRKNLASTSSSKPASESQNGVTDKVASQKPDETCNKGLFVKINMDGVPIGRKVDLKAYDSYDKLSSAVDELFRGLLAGFSTNLFFNLDPYSLFVIFFYFCQLIYLYSQFVRVFVGM